LQQSETKFPIGGGHLLSLWRQRRNPAIGRLDIIEVRAPVCFMDMNTGAIGAGDVEFGPALHTLVAAEQRRSLFVQFFPLCLGEEFLVSRI